MQKAAELTQALEAAADSAARKKVISDNAELWRELKPVLKRIAHGKCWYCEAREDRSDNAVDHFRPKGRVAGSATDEGYWWLAFVAGNYRYSCTFCNSRRVDVETGSAGGKEDRFPLLDEQTRALTPVDDLDAEMPLLLDPLRPLDVALLWFDDSGETRPHPVLAADENGVEARRVEMSREVYHLDHPAIVSRRRRIYREVSRLVEDIDRAFREVATQHSAPSRRLFESALLELRAKVVPTAEHSLAARCALRGYRAENAAAQAVLDSL